MKRVKRILAGLIIAALALSLCSCKKLDEMKRLHAVWNNEDHTEILWNGSVYRKLPEVVSERMYGENVLITDADVPVLLSDIYGQYAHKDVGENLIYFDYYIFAKYSMQCFARSELYDQYEAAARNPNMDRLAAECSIYSHNDGEQTIAAVVLSEELTQRLREAVSSGALRLLSDDEAEVYYTDYLNIYSDPDYDIQGSVSLYLSDEVMLCMESFGGISTYMPNEGGECVHLLSSSGSGEKVFGPVTDEHPGDHVYLFEDNHLYKDLMDELTGK